MLHAVQKVCGISVDGVDGFDLGAARDE